MKLNFIVLTLFFMFCGGMQKIFAQDYILIFSEDYSSRLSLEIDPVTFLYKGYSVNLRYRPMLSEKFLIGMGTYAMDLPELLVDANWENRDKGWKVRIRSAYFLYGEHYFTEANRGWFLGEQLGFQSFKVSNNKEIPGSASFNTLLLMAYVGYSWYPFKNLIYIKPWAGLGYTEKIDGTNKIGTEKYDIAMWFPMATFHVGYTF